jgi:hypothetical protein
MRVRGRDVDDIDIGIRDEFVVAAVRFCFAWIFDVFQEIFGAGLGG